MSIPNHSPDPGPRRRRHTSWLALGGTLLILGGAARWWIPVTGPSIPVAVTALPAVPPGAGIGRLEGQRHLPAAAPTAIAKAASTPAAPAPQAPATPPPTEQQRRAFAQLQELLARQPDAQPPSGATPQPSRLGVAASPRPAAVAAQRKIQLHLSGASRDPARAPSAEYYVQPAASLGGWRVENPNHRLATEISELGITVRPRPDREMNPAENPRAEIYRQDWQVDLQLRALGYEGALQPVEAGTLEERANQLEHVRPGLTEWYVNTGTGLEQGFTLEQPPAERPAPGAPLRLEFRLGTGFTAEVSPDGTSLQLSTSDGQPVLRYADLLAFDATGRQLPARLELTEGIHLAMLVDDRAARYPVMVDPVLTGLVKDINLNTEGSNPYSLVNVNGIVFFSAYEIATGYELWKSDGTTAGTVLVKDINPGVGSSSPTSLTAIGGTLYFNASDGITGNELWKSDGTEAGTILVKDIYPGGASSYPSGLAAVGGTLFFNANDGVTSNELWKSDGTTAGTVLVKDIYPGSSGSGPSSLTAVGGTLYFTASDPSYGSELWRSDGTIAGTVMIKDLYPGNSSSYPSALTAVGSTLYFTASDPGYGSELYKSDGTTAGTVLVKDIWPGVNGSGPSFLTALGNTLYFNAFDPSFGNELWRSDGTAAGTVMVRDIITGGTGSNPSYLKASGSFVYFVTTTYSSSYYTTYYYRYLWRSDGTSAGTIQLAYLQQYYCGYYGGCSGGSSSPEFTPVGSLVYLRAGDSGQTLARTDGSTAGTFGLRTFDSGSGPSGIVALGNQLLFTAGGSTYTAGRELWKSDGTFAGTTLVKDINGQGVGSYPSLFAAMGDALYFQANDGVTGSELWKSDGTPAGTVLVKDVYPGLTGSAPQNLTAVGSTLYFIASDPTYGQELWKSDGTTVGTLLVKDIYAGGGGSSPQYLTAVGNTLYFNAYEGATGRELWKSDGTAAGTVLVKDIYAGGGGSSPQTLTAVDNTLYFNAYEGAAGWELWKSDGTAAGTVLVKDIYPGSLSGNPGYLTAVGSTVYFLATDPSYGSELWKSDGTTDGTVLVKDIYPGSNGSGPQNLTPVGGTLYFSANEPTTGLELWKSDGTTAGTVLVKDIYPGSLSGNPVYLTAVGNTVYFRAAEPNTGQELWKSDGSTAGTVLVKDLWPGGTSGDPQSLTAVGDVIFFNAQDSTHGRELWRSDGTAAGTVLAADLWPGANGSNPQSLKAFGQKLFFAASDGQTGNELWYALDIPNLAPTDLALAPSVVAENQPAGTVVGLLATTDPDAADTHSYTLVSGADDNDNSLFSVVGAEIRTAAIFDFETKNSYSIRVRTTDNGGLYLEQPLSIQVADVNEPPVAVNDAYALGEDMVLAVGNPAVGLLKNDSDADGDALTAILVSGPAHGTLALQPDGRFTYTPEANFNGPDSFTYRVNDGQADSGVATVTITVNPVNDAPVAVAQSVTTAEDATVALLLAGTDVENDPLSYAVATAPAHGTLSGTAPNLTYTPAANYHGPDSFTFTVADATATSAPATVLITVTPVNDVPVAVAQSVTTAEDTVVAVLLTGTDADADPLSYTVATAPAHGTLSGTAPNLTYTPASNYHGPDSFTFTVADATATSAPATVAITVTPVNDAPVAVAQSVSTAEDAPVALLLAGTDADADPLSYTVATAPAHGTLSGTAPNLTYTPAANYHGPDSFTFTVADGTATSAPATVAITVTTVNDGDPGDVVVGLALAADGPVFSTTPQPDGKLVVGGGFTTLGGLTRNYLARVNADGTVDAGFNPNANGQVNAAAIQRDGKIVVGGGFTTMGGAAHNRLARLNPDGSVDATYNPDFGHQVLALTVQPDGRILVGGYFTTVNGTPRNYVARLNEDGSLDTGFNPNANGFVYGAALQPDGRIVVGGNFTAIGGVARNYSARLNADGSVDAGFNPSADGQVRSTVLQPDGRLVIAGNFYTVGGQPRGSVARLNPNGTLDTGFNPNADAVVHSLSLQTDGKIVLGGAFSTVGGQPRNRVARVNPDGTLDPSFNPEVSGSSVFSTAVRADGQVAVGGIFGTVGGLTRGNLAWLANDTATQALTVPGPDRVQWLRGGASPEAQSVTFESSEDGGATWTALGSGTRITGGWEITGLHLTGVGQVRARARLTGGYYNGSSGLAEATAAFAFNSVPVALAQSVTTAEDTSLAITLTASDADQDPLSFSIVGAPSHGSLGGTPPNLTYTPAANYHGADSFTFRVNDGLEDSALATVTISVAPVNDAPVAANDSFTTAEDTALTVGGAPARGGAGGTVAVVDRLATFDALQNGTDLSNYTEGGLRIATPATAFLNLGAAYYPSGGANGATSIRLTDGSKMYAVEFFTYDGWGSGHVHHLHWWMKDNGVVVADGVFSAGDPLISGFSRGAGFDELIVGAYYTADLAAAATPTSYQALGLDNVKVQLKPPGVLANDTDVEGDALTAQLVSGPAHGTVNLLADGGFTYTPEPNFNGVDSFTYRASDGSAVSEAATVAITVTPVNDAPVANSQSVTVAEDGEVTITLTGLDVDGDPLSLGLTGGPAHGSVSINSPTVTYRPAANYHGPDALTFVAHDGKAFSAPATISITVTPVNDAPEDRDRTVSVWEDNGGGQVQPQVDVDGDAVTYFVVTPPQHGRVELQGGNLIYLPEANYTGPDSYTFKATDGTLESPLYTYTINVLPVNDAPVASAQSVTTAEDTAVTITLGGSDVDGDALNFAVANGPVHGSLSGTAPNLTYTPAANYHGPDSLTFTVNDGTVTSAAATVSITVTPVNDPPVAMDDSYTVTEDGSLVATGGIGSLARGSSGTAVGSVDRSATFDAVVSGTDLNGYTEGGLRVSVPKVGFISGALFGGYFYPNGGANAATSIRTTDGAKIYALEFATSDGWGDPHPVSYLHWWMLENGNIVADGVLETGHRTISGFSRGAGFDELLVGAYYTAADAAAATPTSYQALALDNLKVQLKRPGVLANDTDPDGDPMSVQLESGPQHGTVTLSADGGFTYSPEANFEGTDTFTYRVNDGSTDSEPATVSLTVTPVNDLPSAEGQDLTTYDNQPLAITLAGSDVETSPLTYRIVTGPAAGTLGGTPPNVIYTPPYPYAGHDHFTFEVEDAGGATAQATVSITILASDRPPVAVAGDDLTVAAGPNCLATVTVDGGGSSDPDGDVLAYQWSLVRDGQVIDSVIGSTTAGWTLPLGTYSAVLTVSYEKGGTTVSATDTMAIEVVPSAPLLAALNPSGAYANGPGFNLSVSGGCFLPGAVVHWNGQPRPTTVVSSSQVVAQIPAADLQTGVDIAVAAVQVVNGDGQASNPLGFSIVAQTVGTADAAVSEPGQTSTVSTAPTTSGDPGVTVSVQNGGTEPVTVLAATYDTKPVGETAFQVDNGSYVDVQVAGATANVAAKVFFYYPATTTGGMENRVKLRWFDGANWIAVLSSGGLPPAKDTTDNLDGTVSGGRFTAIFDATSTPTISQLTGTVFGMFPSEPQLGTITGPTGPVALGNTISITANFAVVGDPADASVRFLWADGTESTVTPQTDTSATASHRYATPGVYGVTVQVTDGQGDVREGRFEYVVIYDPNGGFVTGGGWIESAPGAYLFDLTLSGKATFGFNSKYLKGQSVPSGQTQFQFQAGDFRFQSTAYEWLVVSGAKAQYKGVGQVNGVGDYGFLLTATDGQLTGGGGLDLFRIKVWDRATGTVVYDNRRGASDDLTAADPQVIGGGSIVIQKPK